MHDGIDFKAKVGSPVRSSASGQVLMAGRGYRGYGVMIVVDHGEGWSTLYAHLSRVSVRPGQMVEQGQVIGYSGRTGRVTGAHLHFEIRKKSDPLDPLLFMPRQIGKR